VKILFIGDVFAEAGRKTVEKFLPSVIKEHSPNLVIANAENLTHGTGFAPEHIEEMQRLGVNFFTAGNHVWSNRKGVMEMGNPSFPLIRPANYPDKTVPGRGYAVIEDSMMNKVLVVNLMGRAFIKPHLDCPFREIDKILMETKHEHLSAIVVDFHAEATSEKYAMAHYLDGRVSLLVGTHTHVPTADACILDEGTAFMSDAGMTGSFDSVIGIKNDLMLHHFLTQMPPSYEPETVGKMSFNAVLVELDEKTKKALNIKHIQKFFTL
jgi:hypothetical protein